MSDSGWVNGEVLMKYLEEHFLKFVQRGPNLKNQKLIKVRHRTKRRNQKWVERPLQKTLHTFSC
jgi:hypothetical protein